MDVTIRTKPKTAPQVANPPITPEVALVCEACQGFTLHKYAITRRAGFATFEQIYGCMSCKTERRYGLIT